MPVWLGGIRASVVVGHGGIVSCVWDIFSGFSGLRCLCSCLSFLRCNFGGEKKFLRELFGERGRERRGSFLGGFVGSFLRRDLFSNRSRRVYQGIASPLRFPYLIVSPHVGAGGFVRCDVCVAGGGVGCGCGTVLQCVLVVLVEGLQVEGLKVEFEAALLVYCVAWWGRVVPLACWDLVVRGGVPCRVTFLLCWEPFAVFRRRPCGPCPGSATNRS